MNKGSFFFAFLFLAHILSATTDEKYVTAYEMDATWPHKVIPSEQIAIEGENTVLHKNIPLAFIRAYPDGQILVVDRSGAVLIDHEKTDFLEQVESEIETSSEGKELKAFLNQIARRAIDLSFSENKAVSEAEFSKYKSFLVIRASCEEPELTATLTKLDTVRQELAEQGIRPLLVFEELVGNEAFYQKIKDAKIMFPVLAPIFQTGFKQAIFSQREENKRVLHLSINGKLHGAYENLGDFEEHLSGSEME